MNPSLVITASGLVFLLAFSLGLFGFIIIRRLVLARRQARINLLYGEMEKDVLEAISLLSPEFSKQLARRHKNHPRVLTRVLLDYGDMIVGEGRDHLKIIFDYAVKGHCLRHLASKRTSRRLRSVRLFVIFFDASERAFLLRLLDDKPIIRLAAVSALSRVPFPETLGYIFSAFEEGSGFAVQAYFNIMFSLGNRIAPLVRAFLNKPLSVDKLALLVELVGAIPLRTLYPDVVALAGHPDKEIRLRVARALGKLLVPETGDKLVTLSSDEAWEVKAQAVKSLGRMRNVGTLDILTGALFSPYWHVRFNAGHALAEMGDEGLRRLREVAAQDDDKYARDMSAMVLNDLIVPGEAA
jgi:hypothetical protein